MRGDIDREQYKNVMIEQGDRHRKIKFIDKNIAAYGGTARGMK